MCRGQSTLHIRVQVFFSERCVDSFRKQKKLVRNETAQVTGPDLGLRRHVVKAAGAERICARCRCFA